MYELIENTINYIKEHISEYITEYIGDYYSLTFTFEKKIYLVYSTSIELLKDYVLKIVRAGPIQKKRLRRDILLPKETKISKKKLTIKCNVDGPLKEGYFMYLFMKYIVLGDILEDIYIVRLD